jgi:CRISPR-associated protein Csb1
LWLRECRRDAVLALSALKLLRADTPEATRKLQLYILGLSLVAFTRLPLEYYRQGTILVLNPEKRRKFRSVKADGSHVEVAITRDDALAFAAAAAADFGVGESKIVEFDAKAAKTAIDEAKKGKKKG